MTTDLVLSWYRKWDSNPHRRYAQGILSPSCLPFHHFGSLGDNVMFHICVCKGSKLIMKTKTKQQNVCEVMEKSVVLL